MNEINSTGIDSRDALDDDIVSEKSFFVGPVIDADSSVVAEHAERNLAHTLKPRHLSLMALGGVIGAGLLVASSGAILSAGPAVIIAYVAAGIIMVLVMRMLGEMASTSPETGSFSAYATRFIGPWAGLCIGWLYWWLWVVAVGIEAIAAASIVTKYLPWLDQWIPALVITVTFLVINLVSVRSFGELEYWFASFKVVAVALFLIVGCLLVVGWLPGIHAVSPPLDDGGGFFPHGIGGILAALMPVVFSMFGAEIATIAAGESEHPQHAVRKAVNSVVWRLLLFYIGSIALILLLIPWTEIQAGKSPFVSALEYVGIPGTDVVMDIVVLSALISTLNAALYTASRMVYSLAGRGEAPRAMRTMSRRNIPYVAILATAVVGFLAVGLNFFFPDVLFAFLVNSTGAIVLLVWLTIAVSQLRSRTKMEHDGLAAAMRADTIRMWGFPYITWAVILTISALLVYMAVQPNVQTRIELYLSLTIAAVTASVGLVVQRRHKPRFAKEEKNNAASVENM